MHHGAAQPVLAPEHLGGLADLAPSLCELLGLEPDPKMSGRKLLSCKPKS